MADRKRSVIPGSSNASVPPTKRQRMVSLKQKNQALKQELQAVTKELETVTKELESVTKELETVAKEFKEMQKEKIQWLDQLAKKKQLNAVEADKKQPLGLKELVSAENAMKQFRVFDLFFVYICKLWNRSKENNTKMKTHAKENNRMEVSSAKRCECVFCVEKPI